MAYSPLQIDLLRKAAGYPQRNPQAVDEGVQGVDFATPYAAADQYPLDAALVDVAQNTPTQADINSVSRNPASAAEPTESELTKRQNDLQLQLEPLVSAQKLSVDDMAALEKAANTNSFMNLNLAPMLSLFDSQMGTNTAKGYVSPQERALDAIKAKKAVSDTRGTIIDDLTKANANIKDLLKLKEVEKRDQGRKAGATKDFGNKVINETTKVNNVAAEMKKRFDRLETVYKSGDIRQIKSVAGDMARLNGNVGATSDADANRQLAETLDTLLARVDTFVGGDGKLKPEAVKYYVDLIKMGRDSMGKITDEKLNALREGFAAHAANLAEQYGMPDLMAPGSKWGSYFDKRTASTKQGFKPLEQRELEAEAAKTKGKTQPKGVITESELDEYTKKHVGSDKNENRKFLKSQGYLIKGN